MQEWQSLLAQLYDHFEEHDKKTSLIQDIDRTILHGDVTPLKFTIHFVERLLGHVDADGCLFFQRVGPDFYALRHASPQRHLPERLDSTEIPKLSNVLRREDWPHSHDWIPTDANKLLCEPVMFGTEQWGLLIFHWKRPLPAGLTFISDVVSQLSIGVATLMSREQIALFRKMHSLFFERDLDQKACLEAVRDETLAILSKHEKSNLLLQILFTEPISTDSDAIGEPLVIRWSSNPDEVGVRVPLDSFSGRAMKSGQPYVLGDPTAPQFAASYKAFTGSSLTELAVVLRKDSGSEPLGVLNVESPQVDAFSPDEIQRIRGLVDLVSPMLAAVRRRVAMARSEKSLAAVAVDQTMVRLGLLYEHKFRTLQFGIDGSLEMAQEYLTAGRTPDAKETLGSMAKVLVNLKNAHHDLWERVKSVSRIAPVRVSEVVAEMLQEEKVTNEKYVTVDSASLDTVPPVRASGLLKEHLRNVLNNAVRAIEKRPAAPDYKAQISISAERYAHSQKGQRQGRDDIAELNQRVRITIRDNGVGLSREMEDKIFEIGYSGWGTSGYGLPAARQYARELGGNVKAVGGVGGCTIVIELPVYVPGED